MTDNGLPDELRSRGTLRLGPGSGADCLGDLEPILSEQGMNGPIEVYSLEDLWVAVEPVPGGDRVLRAYSSLSEAEDFVRRRMDQFDRLWDGCGCRIDYDRRDPGW